MIVLAVCQLVEQIDQLEAVPLKLVPRDRIRIFLRIVSTAFVTKATVEEAPINITAPAQSTDAENVPTFPATGTQTPAK